MKASKEMQSARRLMQPGDRYLKEMAAGLPIRRDVFPEHQWSPFRFQPEQVHKNLRFNMPAGNGARGPYNLDSGGSLLPVEESEDLRDLHFTNCEFLGLGRTLWLLRLYEIAGAVTFTDCRFAQSGVYPTPEPGRQTEGHDFYGNLLSGGSASFERCAFEYSQGNAIQIVDRENETAFPWSPDPKPGLIRIAHSTMTDVSQDGYGRGSFPVSLFNSGQDVQVDSLAIRYTRRTPIFRHDGMIYRSQGGIQIGHAQNPSQRVENVSIRNVDVDQTQPFHEALRAQGANHLVAHTLRLVSRGGNQVSKIEIHDDCPAVSLRDVQPIAGTTVRVMALHDDGTRTHILSSKKPFTLEWGV